MRIHKQYSWIGNEDKMSERMQQNVYRGLSWFFKLPIALKENNQINIIGLNDLYRNLGRSNLFSTPNYTYNYLYYANQLNYAWFQYVMNDGKEIKLRIVDKEISTTGQFKNERIGSGMVSLGIQTALILRDKEALAYYANIPLEFTAQANQEDLLSEAMLLFYQTAVIKGLGTKHEAHGTINALTELLVWENYIATVEQEGFNQEWVWKLLFKSRKQYYEHVNIPVLAIYHAILHQDQALYERAVYEALISWKAYYTLVYIDENQEERDHSLEPAGYLSLPITAACAYAYDKGMKLQTIESDYLCKWMIEGRFEEFELLVKG